MGSTSLQQPESVGRLWLSFAIVSVAIIMMAATRWILTHPYGVYWDEALYFNQSLTNIRILHTGNLYHMGGVIVRGDASRPPAYRLLVLPLLSLFGLHIATARFMSLALYAVSAWFVYLSTRRIASPAAGAVAVLAFSLSPQVVLSSICFTTEGPLFVATSAMLYFLFVHWSVKLEQPGNWIGLGLAIGLGLLSKASFTLIAFPVLAFSLIDAYRRRLGLPSMASVFKAAALALIVAGPWWLFNIKSCLSYTQYARGFVRGSFGPSSHVMWITWLGTVALGLLGPGLCALIVLVAVAFLRKAILRREAIVDPVQRTALLACACAGLPLVVAQLSGTNYVLHHISPAVIPLAIALGVLADKSAWIRSGLAIAISGALLSVQLGMIVMPVLLPNNHPVDPGLVNGALPWRIMVRFDQWDWKTIREISQSCGIETPRISFLGNGRAFNPPQIEYPWVAVGASSPEVTWLWRYEQGPLNWQEVMGAVEQSDIVLTAPRYLGQVTDKQDLDNQHNAEFAKRLTQDSRFRGPIRLEMGRFEPVEVQVFLRKTLLCQAGQEAQNQTRPVNLGDDARQPGQFLASQRTLAAREIR